LRALELDSERSARHAVKVILTFSLLDRERMPLAELPAFLDRVPLFGDFNRRYLHKTTPELAQWLVAELTRVGVAEVVDGVLRSRGGR
jgi:hypothetical protein